MTNALLLLLFFYSLGFVTLAAERSLIGSAVVLVMFYVTYRLGAFLALWRVLAAGRSA